MQNLTTYNAIIGATLRKFREHRGIEQGAIAAELGLTQSSFSRIESGQTSLTLVQLNRVCQYLNMRPDTFVAEVERVKEGLIQRGVVVQMERSPNLGEGVTNVLLGAALLAVVTQFLRN